MAGTSVTRTLIIGDTLAILLFAAMGKAEHDTGLALVSIFVTAAPFLVAWFGVGIWLRAFRPEAVDGVGVAVRKTFWPWLLAWPIGLQLRALLLQREIPFGFAVVVLVTNLVLLAGWRAAFAWFRAKGEKRHE